MVTYELIASRFNDVSASAWVLTGYNLGYCIALPVVRTDGVAPPTRLRNPRR